MLELRVTEEYLREHPDHLFVFGDNMIRRGTDGAATLRHLPNTYGFITKRLPDMDNMSFFLPENYQSIFLSEVQHLLYFISNHPEFTTVLISELGSGLANRYHIWEQIIQPWFDQLPDHHGTTRIIKVKCSK